MDKVLLVIGRDNWHKNHYMNRFLLPGLEKHLHRIHWEDPATGWIYQASRFMQGLDLLPARALKTILRLCQVLYGVFHWRYFPDLKRRRISFESRCQSLVRTIDDFGKGKDIIIIAYSSGARAASLIADGLGICHLICVGYPFRGLSQEVEPDRYRHLARLSTPMLIIQGDHDEYGGVEIKDKYAFSPAIEIDFMDADHQYRASQGEWKRVLAKINGVIQRYD